MRRETVAFEHELRFRFPIHFHFHRQKSNIGLAFLVDFHSSSQNSSCSLKNMEKLMIVP